MLDSEFTEGMTQLRALYRGVTEEFEELVHKKFRSVPGPVWLKAIDLCVDTRDERDKPGVTELWRYVSKAREAMGFSERELQSCRECGGIGSKSGSFRRKSTGEVITAETPCFRCRPGYELKPDLEPVLDTELYAVKTAREMGCEGAKISLERIGRLNLQVPDEVMQPLLESSCKPSRPKVQPTAEEEIALQVVEMVSPKPEPKTVGSSGMDRILEQARPESLVDKPPGIVVEQAAPPVRKIVPLTDEELRRIKPAV